MRNTITVGRISIGFCACVIAAFISVSPAGADATDDYPIPKRIWQTPCDAEQVLAAVRDTSPIYYERYIIDKSNRPADVQQGAVDRINWFFSLTPADRRAHSKEVATNIYGEPMAQRWGNWAKVFFNNKGVAAKATDVCMNYSRGDMSVWDWPVLLDRARSSADVPTPTPVDLFQLAAKLHRIGAYSRARTYDSIRRAVLPSPYSPGALPAYLAGRGTELETIRARLARTSMLGRSGGPLLAFYGSRGLGKTSLLRAAQREAVAAGYLTVWVTGRDDVTIAPELAASLTAEISSRSTSQKAKGLLQNLSKVQLEVGVPGAKVGVEADRTRATAVIEHNLADAGRFARQHDHHGLAVFVDEFQEAQLADRRSLLIALQHFDGAPEGCPVAIIAAGLPSLLAAVPQAATFGERTDFVEIGLLGDVAVAEALRLPAQELGVSWSDDAIVAAIEAAAGYPHRVQLLGDSAWEAGRPGNGDVIGLAQVRMGAERAESRMAALFRSRMAKINPEQRRVVMAMAALGDQPVSRAAVAGRLGITSEALSRPRQELIDRGLIESAGRGLLRFTIPGFAGFLRTSTDVA